MLQLGREQAKIKLGISKNILLITAIKAGDVKRPAYVNSPLLWSRTILGMPSVFLARFPFIFYAQTPQKILSSEFSSLLQGPA